MAPAVVGSPAAALPPTTRLPAASKARDPMPIEGVPGIPSDPPVTFRKVDQTSAWVAPGENTARNPDWKRLEQLQVGPKTPGVVGKSDAVVTPAIATVPDGPTRSEE